MRFATVTTFFTAASLRVIAQDTSVTGELGDAVVVENNPLGAVYRATFGENPFLTPDTPAGGPILGEVVVSTPPDQVGVMFTVSFQNLPKEGGPFSYHLHVDPVPEDGDCTKTLAHLDPFIRGEDPVCDSTAPETCQVGDLSGKYGKVEVNEGTSYRNSYIDEYSALFEGPGAFFGNRSIVLHYANKTRLACANFVLENGGIVNNPEEDGEDCTTTELVATETASAAIPTASPFTNSTTIAKSAPSSTTSSEDSEPTNSDPIFDGGAVTQSISVTLLTAALSIIAFLL